MPSTYTVNLGIEKPATGEQSGTWGDTVNDNSNILDEAINGAVTITLSSAGSSGSPNSITITNGASSTGRNKWIEFDDGGDLGAAAYVQLTPNDAEKICNIRNSLSGSRSIFIFQGTYSTSNDLEIAAGTDVVVKFNGGGTGATVVNVYANLKVDGIVATTADINGGTIDATVIGGSTAAAVTGTTVVANTSVNIAGDGATVTGIKDEDNMASNSATKLATQQSIKAYVDSQVGTVDTLAEVLAGGNTSGSTDIDMDNAQKVQFRDAAIYINSSTDGQLDIVADAEIQIVATTIDINGAINASGEIIAASLDISGNVDIDGITNLDAVDIDGAVQIDAAVTVGIDGTGHDVKFFGDTGGNYMLWDQSADDLILAGTSSLSVGGDVDVDGTIEFDALSGTGSVTITDIKDEDNMASNSATMLATQQSIKAYVDAQVDTVDTLAEVLAIGNTSSGTNVELTTTDKVQFRDAAIYLNSSVDGQLDIVADTEIQLAATAVDINAAVNISGLIDAGGNALFSSDNPIVDLLATGGNDATLRLREAGTGIVGAEIIYDGGTNLLNFRVGNNTDTVRLSIARDSGNFVTTPTTAGHAVFNEDGVDADFRVESDTQTHMLFVDGGNNAVGIGTSGPIRTLHVNSAATSDIARFDNNSGGMTFGYAGTQASIDLATSAAFRIRQGSVVPLTISTAGDLLLGTTSKAGAGGITLDSGGSWSNINLYGAGTSQGGRLYFGDSSDRASIVGQYGSGGGGQLTFNTDTTGGTSLQRVKIDNSGNVFFNGVREYHQSMSLNNGTAYTFDIPIQSTGAGYTMTYECMYNHFGNTSYGSWQSGFLSFRSLNNSAYSVDMTKNHAPSGSGGWTVSMVGGGTATPSIRFTKSAGTYGGAGYGHIFIRGGKS